MSKIIDVKATEILDSRGNPTVKTTVTTELGFTASFSVPSGASTGEKEALELRDKDENRYNGKGVLKAVENVNGVIKDAILGMECKNQKSIDEKLIELDGTQNKSNLGANAILSVSIACLKVASKEDGKSIYEYLNKNNVKTPYAMFNIINGGMHSDNNLDIQEFMIVPKFNSFKEILRSASEIFSTLKNILKEEGLNTSVGDEGGFAPNLNSNEDALKKIVSAIKKSAYKPGKEVFIAMDVAASSLYDKDTKLYQIDNSFKTKEELLEYYKHLLENYPIISIEDPYDEYDEEGFKLITDTLGSKISIVGDDLFVTNKKLLENGINKGLCNAILIKPNQIGTFYEMVETVVYAKKHNYITIMSHRSGETNDSFIADAAVALGMPFIKAGSVSRGERLAKYNRLMEIEDEIK